MVIKNLHFTIKVKTIATSKSENKKSLMFVKCNVFSFSSLLVVTFDCSLKWLTDFHEGNMFSRNQVVSLQNCLYCNLSLSLFVCPFIFLSWSQLLSSVFLFSLFIPSFYNLSLFVCPFSLFSFSLFVFQHS